MDMDITMPTFHVFGEADETIACAMQSIGPDAITAPLGFINTFVVICHGSKHGPCPIINGRSTQVSPEDLAYFILNHPDYTGGAVLILMCWGGDETAACIWRIADYLRRPVIGCTTMVCSTTGTAWTRTPGGELVQRGSWVVAWPR